MKKFNRMMVKPFKKKKKFNDVDEDEIKKEEKKETVGDFTYKKLENDYYYQYRSELGEDEVPKEKLGSMIVNIYLNTPEDDPKREMHALYIMPGYDAKKVHQLMGVCGKYEKQLVDNVVVEYWAEYRAGNSYLPNKCGKWYFATAFENGKDTFRMCLVRFLEDNESILQLRQQHVASKNHFLFVFHLNMDRFAALINKERYFIHPSTVRRRFKKSKPDKDPEKIQITDVFFCLPVIPLPGTEDYAESLQAKAEAKAKKKAAKKAKKKTRVQAFRSWFKSSKQPVTLDELLTPTEGELSSLSVPPLLPEPGPSREPSAATSPTSPSQFDSSIFSEGSPSSPSNLDFAEAGPSGLSDPETPSCSHDRLTPEHMDTRLDPPLPVDAEEGDYCELKKPEDKKPKKKASSIYYCKEHPPVSGGLTIQPIYCSTVYVREEKKGKQCTVDELSQLPGGIKKQIQNYNWEMKFMLLRERTLYFVRDHPLLMEYYQMENTDFLRLLHASFGYPLHKRTLIKIGEVFKYEFYHSPMARAHYNAPYGSVIIVKNLDVKLNPIKMMFCPYPKKITKKTQKGLMIAPPVEREDIDRTSRLKNLWMTALRLSKVGADHKQSFLDYKFEYLKHNRNAHLQGPHDQRMQNYQRYWQKLAEEELEAWKETDALETEAIKVSDFKCK